MLSFKQFISEDTDDYMFHATSHENLWDILDSGKIKTHKPSHGTDQSTWPDGSNKKRSYWSHSENIAKSFHPENGKPVMLRIKRDLHPFKRESGTGDHYLEKPINLDNLEFNHNGEWKSIKDYKS